MSSFQREKFSINSIHLSNPKTPTYSPEDLLFSIMHRMDDCLCTTEETAGNNLISRYHKHNVLLMIVKFIADHSGPATDEKNSLHEFSRGQLSMISSLIPALFFSKRLILRQVMKRLCGYHVDLKPFVQVELKLKKLLNLQDYAFKSMVEELIAEQAQKLRPNPEVKQGRPKKTKYTSRPRGAIKPLTEEEEKLKALISKRGINGLSIKVRPIKIEEDDSISLPDERDLIEETGVLGKRIIQENIERHYFWAARGIICASRCCNPPSGAEEPEPN